MRNIKIEIGETIKKRRELLGLLQPQLATISGVSIRTIQLVEKGKGNPGLDTLLQLAAPLGLTLQLTLKDLSKQNKI
ncbi:MAG TPA: helix-turn-helix domain-containing protein [Chitinophagaceae bacterium]|nr:helix-turn-helix domain-containing protein [Chitinophagaceae bacterium]